MTNHPNRRRITRGERNQRVWNFLSENRANMMWEAQTFDKHFGVNVSFWICNGRTLLLREYMDVTDKGLEWRGVEIFVPVSDSVKTTDMVLAASRYLAIGQRQAQPAKG